MVPCGETDQSQTRLILFLERTNGGDYISWKSLYQVGTCYKNQHESREILQKIQLERLKYIVNYAYRESPLYREKFKKKGVDPSDIRTLDDIAKIPLVTKGEIKNAFPQGVIPHHFTKDNCIVKTTSGSSGNVLTVFCDRKAADYLTAVAFRDHLAQGVRPWHTFCIILNNPEELKKSGSFLYRTVNIPGQISPDEMVSQARIHQPHIMGGHPSTLVAMAHVVERTGITDLTPEKILLGGEVAHPPYREYIEKIFQCETLNRYGACETHSIAWECSHHNMHINSDSVILETVESGEPVSPGEQGEIVVTNLWNRAMPFIRYRLEDIGVLSDTECSCGRTLPLLQSIEGRLDDFIVLPSGELVPPSRLIPFFFYTKQIRQFRVVQEGRPSIKIEVTPGEGFTQEVEDILLENIRAILGESVTVDLERTNNIGTGRGKLKRVHSTVGHRFKSNPEQ